MSSSGSVTKATWSPPNPDDVDTGPAAKQQWSKKMGGDGGTSFGSDDPKDGFMCPKGAYITHLDGGWWRDNIGAFNLIRFKCSDGTNSRDAGPGGKNWWKIDEPGGFLGMTGNSGNNYVNGHTFMGASGHKYHVGGVYEQLPDFWCPKGQKVVGMKGKVGGVIDQIHWKCDYPINCDDISPGNLWNPQCDRFELAGAPEATNPMFNKRRDYCNAEGTWDEAVCDTFCNKYPNSCQHRLDCVATGLSGDACTPAAVTAMESLCQKKGMLVGGLGQGHSKRPCTQTELDKLDAECDKYGLQRGDGCNNDAVMLAETNAKTAAAAQKVIDNQALLQDRQHEYMEKKTAALYEALDKPVVVVPGDYEDLPEEEAEPEKPKAGTSPLLIGGGVLLLVIILALAFFALM